MDTSLSLPAAAAPAEFAQTMPALLVSLLERRYLSGLDVSRWRLDAPADDGSRPLLREIRAMPRPAVGADPAQAMPHVLAASHSLGQAVVTAVYGDTATHRFYIGGRRVPHGAVSSTEDFLTGQASVLGAHLPGLELGPAEPLGRDGHEELANFLTDAPALAVITGIPSGRAAAAATYQNLDRLTDAAAGQKYAVLIVAEPLDPGALDNAVDACRRLKSETHALVRRTVTEGQSEGTTTSASRREQAGESAGATFTEMLPNVLSGFGVFCALAGLIPVAHPLMALASPAIMGGNLTRANLAGAQDTVSSGTSKTLTKAGSTELLNASAEACERLLDAHIGRLDAARSGGWWRTAVYVAAETDGTLAAVTAALRAICSGGATSLDPMRANRIEPWAIRPALTRGQTVTLRPAPGLALPVLKDASSSGGLVGHPLGSAFDALATCMTTDELAVLLSLPRREVAGLRMRDVAEFALSAPAHPGERGVTIGRLLDSAGRRLAPVRLTAAEINRHVLVTGMTGYGKTTTAKRLLTDARAEFGVPFLVIEPAKAEYRQLRGDPELRRVLRVYNIGGTGWALPLRLNPFAPVDGAPLGRHIDLLKSVFNAAFPMFAGMPAVLEEAMLDIYADRGWDLRTGQNRALGPRPPAAVAAALMPTLGDLHDQVEVVLARKGYAGEVHQNMGAALRSRIKSLMVGAKGDALAARRSIPPRDLFGSPAIIELKDLADDEEKSFVMGLLLALLYEYAESRQPDPELTGGRLQHITLIEEAHRLLRAPRNAGMETGDAQAKAVTMFTDMLAEMRAYGEAFVVADQIPTKLAPEVLKNTNIKITHRLAAPDDRAAVASSVNLTEAQSRYLVALRPGTAVVHDDMIESAVVTAIDPPAAAAPPAAGLRTSPDPELDRSYLHRNAACGGCSRPCEFLAHSLADGWQESADASLGSAFDALLAGDASRARTGFAAWLASAGRGAAPTATDDPDTSGTGSDGTGDRDGLAYCAASQSGYRWLGRLVAARSQAHAGAGASAVKSDDQATAATRFSPGDLVTWEQGARHVARAVAGLLKPPSREADGLVGQGASDLRALVAAAPATELNGCAACPARCLMLPAAVGFLEGAGRGVPKRVSAATPPATRLRSVAELLDPAFPELTPAQRRNLTYCVVTNAAHAAGTDPSDLLAELGQRSS